MKRPRQLELLPPRAPGWGGARKGAGRKKRTNETVPHARRPRFPAAHPLHVTVRMARGVYNLRSQRCFRHIERVLRREKESGAARFVHYSVQGNHVHMLVEAPRFEIVSRRMHYFAVRLAAGLNRLMRRRRGKVFAERYHLRVLRSPSEVRNALRYVLCNRARHVGGPVVDPYSTGPWFEGWSFGTPTLRWTPCTGPPPVSSPSTWLLSRGWRRLGPIRA